MDILIGLWVVSLGVMFVWAYFRGARKQLEKCLRFRHCDWMDDSRWVMESDIRKLNERFHF